MIFSKVLSLKFLPLVKSDFKTLINMLTLGKTDWLDQKEKKLNLFFIKLNDGAGFLNNLNVPRVWTQYMLMRQWDRETDTECINHLHLFAILDSRLAGLVSGWLQVSKVQWSAMIWGKVMWVRFLLEESALVKSSKWQWNLSEYKLKV